VNFASAKPKPRVRSRTNQPGLAFPQSPGIILKQCDFLAITVTVSPIRSLTLHRHARYRAMRQEVLGASPFRSPRDDFSAPGSVPSGHTASLFSTEPVARNGLSLARNGCSFSEASIPGSTVLTCHFATSQLGSLPGPPSTPLPSLVCPS
jgi:hypothetical protein